MSFASLGLSPALVHALADLQLSEPTAIQAAAIPAALRGGDVLGAARTGSGKTAAYALPLLQQCLDDPWAPGAPRRLRGLVLAPTRELAAQVGDWLREVAESLPGRIKVAVVFGGVSINPQMMALRGGADIVVATPGRLLDLIEHRALSLGELATLVLDEADRLLDLGFADELARILSLLPGRRQTLFFSATYPQSVQALADSLLHEPTRIEIEGTPDAHADIEQHAIAVDAPRRTQLLRHLVETEGWPRVLVFVATQYSAGLVADKLRRAGLQAAELHGQMSQGGRTRALADFKAAHLQVLVVTDLAARGIDIEQLPAVVNYDLPRSAVDHVHRIGRTGRAGQGGVAISFVTPDMEGHFRLIEKRQGLRLPREQIEGFEPTEVASEAEVGLAEAGHEEAPSDDQPRGLDPQGGVKGRRKSKKDKLREAAAREGAAPPPKPPR